MSKIQFNFLQKKELENNEIKIISKIEKEYFKNSFYSENELIKLNKLENYFFFILKKNKNIISYCIYSLVLNEVDIYKIWVSTCMRKKGIGKTIINNILNLERISKIHADVEALNINARKFYNKMGFEEVRERDNYYKNGLSAITLLKIK